MLRLVRRALCSRPALPPPTGGPARGSGATKLRVGEEVALPEMGPAVVNEDGTLAYINNWSEMAPVEREIAWRRVAARNKERLERLRGTES